MAEAKWDKTIWTLYNSGQYNFIFISGDKKNVLKIQKKNQSQKSYIYDLPERSVRLWNLLNPEYHAEVVHTSIGKGWVCPFINGELPTDSEIIHSCLPLVLYQVLYSIHESPLLWRLPGQS